MDDAEPPARAETHIDDLTDDCLIRILSLVGTANLPIECPRYRDVRVCHPLQCAFVCKHWQSCARAAVHSLTLTNRDLEAGLAEQAMHFTGLRRLVLSEGLSCHGVLPQIARATPGFEHLDLDLRYRLACDVSNALRSWTRIKEIGLYGPVLTMQAREMQASLLDILPRMRQVESLSIMYDGLELEAACERLQPHMTHLKKLGLKCSGPPPSCLAAVPSLSLRLTSMPSHVLQFRNIVEIHLDDFQGEELPGEVGSMARLQRLTIENSDLLVSLPSSLGQLSALECLIVKRCSKLSRLPLSIGDLRSLKVLLLTLCKKLRRLPSSLGQLTGVKQLSLDEMRGLQALPRALGSMRDLEDLVVSGYRNSHSLFFRTECPLTKIPVSVGELSRLTQLTLRDLPELEELPGRLGHLSSLRVIHFEGLEFWWNLPDSLGQLSCLESIAIVRCDIFSLPTTLGELSSLTRFRLVRCDKLSDLPKSMSKLSHLHELHIEGCKSVTRLPEEFAELTNLRELVIRNCKRFADVMAVIPMMSSLRFLGLAGYRLQDYLPDALVKLTALQLIKCSPGVIERAHRVDHCHVNIMEADFDGEVDSSEEEFDSSEEEYAESEEGSLWETDADSDESENDEEGETEEDEDMEEYEDEFGDDDEEEDGDGEDEDDDEDSDGEHDDDNIDDDSDFDDEGSDFDDEGSEDEEDAGDDDNGL